MRYTGPSRNRQAAGRGVIRKAQAALGRCAQKSNVLRPRKAREARLEPPHRPALRGRLSAEGALETSGARSGTGDSGDEL